MFKIMFIRALYLLAFSALLPMAVESAPARQSQAPARAGFNAKPSTVPDDYVPMPMGLYVSSQCVITLPNDDTYGTNNISPEGILQPDGTRKPVPPCLLPRYNRDGSLYVAAGDVMDSATGNHDLLISAQAGVSTSQGVRLQTPTIPLPVPGKIAGQTIYFTTAMSAGNNAALQFVGFNMPGFKDTWAAGMIISDYYGNVFLQFATQAYQPSQKQLYTYFDKGAVTNTNSTTAAFQQDMSIDYDGRSARFINYYTTDLLLNNTVFSIQTFGVTSCDMLPPLDIIPGEYSISPFYPKSANVFPKIWSSGLCNMTASIDSGMFGASADVKFRDFTVQYDQQTDAAHRSATFTFTSR